MLLGDPHEQNFADARGDPNYPLHRPMNEINPLFSMNLNGMNSFPNSMMNNLNSSAPFPPMASPSVAPPPAVPTSSSCPSANLQDQYSCHPHETEYMPFINQNYVDNEPIQSHTEPEQHPPPHMMQPKLHMSYPYPPPAQSHPIHRQMMAEMYRHQQPIQPHPPQHQQPHQPHPAHMLDRDEVTKKKYEEKDLHFVCLFVASI